MWEPRCPAGVPPGNCQHEATARATARALDITVLASLRADRGPGPGRRSGRLGRSGASADRPSEARTGARAAVTGPLGRSALNKMTGRHRSDSPTCLDHYITFR